MAEQIANIDGKLLDDGSYIVVDPTTFAIKYVFSTFNGMQRYLVTVDPTEEQYIVVYPVAARTGSHPFYANSKILTALGFETPKEKTAESIALDRVLGSAIVEGDDGEYSVRIDLDEFRKAFEVTGVIPFAGMIDEEEKKN